MRSNCVKSHVKATILKYFMLEWLGYLNKSALWGQSLFHQSLLYIKFLNVFWIPMRWFKENGPIFGYLDAFAFRDPCQNPLNNFLLALCWTRFSYPLDLNLIVTTSWPFSSFVMLLLFVLFLFFPSWYYVWFFDYIL